MEPPSNLNGRETGWPEVEFRASPTGLVAMVLGCAAFAALGVALILGYVPTDGSWIGQLIGWAAIFFGLGCAIPLMRLALAEDPIVTVGPLGVRDTRISPDWIPWAAITDLSAASSPPPPFLLLHIDPAFEATMSLTRRARWARPVNAAMGWDGHVIRDAALEDDLEALLRAIEEGWARAQSG
jgi:hypothetical protein